MTLNITSGEYSYNSLKSKFNGIFIPFNEAMIDGETHQNIFSKDFIQIRSNHHNVTTNEYIDKLYELNKIEFINSFKEIVLWFGLDTFCQINMLTILAYLDQINYIGKVSFIGIDDYTNDIVKEKEVIEIKDFNKIYTDVLINNQIKYSNYSYINHAIDKYFEIISGTDEVSNFIKNNCQMSYEELMNKSLNISISLGLSDTIINKIINKYKYSFFELYYKNELVGKIVFDLGNNIINYKVHNSNLDIFEFLKVDISEDIKNIPFLESRISYLIKNNLSELAYQTDYYLLKRIN